MNKQWKERLVWVLLTVGLVSMTLLVRNLIYSTDGNDAYEEAASLAYSQQETIISSSTEEEDAPAPNTWVPAPVRNDEHLEVMEAINLEALREVNPDVIGWIMVPDTKINYPIMQGEDNDFYLKHTWEGKENGVGSVFLECRNKTDFTEFNTIVYAHNMNDGSMFGDLKKYNSRWQWEKSPYIYITTDQGVFRYEIFASYRAPVDSFTYGLSFNEAETRANFLIEAKNASTLETEVFPRATDRILTLSTCSGAGYSNRWVVQARLKMILTE